MKLISEKHLNWYAWCTLPTLITLFRIALIPFIVYALHDQSYLRAFIFFICAAISDVLDGMLARFLKQQTIIGALLDPLADKLLIGALVVFFTFYTQQLPVWFFMLYVIKECTLICGAAYLFFTNGATIKADVWGKLAMGIQTILMVVLIGDLMKKSFFQSSIMLVFITAFFSVAALFSYAVQAMKLRRSACID
ncbi:MAG TPA: CDP-alcohol phosphatidyltransferase family protein [Candidatus Babeliales bacterium]|nr:CDP-alcohol phosphatidyltransferase family protein [Candidatus Babeliales bacterium]